MRRLHTRSGAWVAWVFLSTLLAGRHLAHADSHTWIGGSGWWNDPSHWSSSGGGCPGAGDDAHITSASSTDIWFAGDYSAGALSSLVLDGTGSPSLVTLSQGDGTAMHAFSEFVGFSGRGYYYQYGGTNLATNLYLGWNPGSIGEYTLAYSSLGSQLTTTVLAIAYDANALGTFNQQAGTVACSYLQLGNYSASSRGYYNFSGGTLSVSAGLQIGNVGAGTFDQIGGVGTVSDLQVGVGSASSGTLLLSGGSLHVTGASSIGGASGAAGYFGLSGTGHFVASGDVAVYSNGLLIQSGGSLNVGGDLVVRGGQVICTSGQFSVAPGRRINVNSGGYVYWGSSYIMPADTGLVVTQGQFDTNGYLDIGRIGHGSLQVDGISASITGYGENWWGSGAGNAATITFANGGRGTFGNSVLGRSGGVGTLSVTSGSTLALGELTAGTGSGTAIVNVSSGTLMVGSASALNIGVGGSATLQFSGGHVYGGAGLTTIGPGGAVTGAGVFHQRGPIVVDGGSWDDLVISLDAAPSSLALAVRDGGTVHAPGGFQNPSSWDYTVTVESAALFDVSPSLVALNPNGVFNLAGGRLNASAILMGGGSFNFTSGTLNFTGPDGFTFSTGGPLGSSFNLPATRTLLIDNNATLTSGCALSVDAGTFSVGGVLTIENNATLGVPFPGVANVSSSGEPSSTPGLNVGNAGGAGTVVLRGSLSAVQSSVGDWGAGTLLHETGDFVLPNGLSVGRYSGSTGHYRFADGTLTSHWTVVGSLGTGTFVQLGGTHTAGIALALGFYPSSLGTYVQSGGTLIVGGEGLSIGGSATLSGGHGTMNVTGGTCNINGNLVIWDDGTLNIGAANVGVSAGLLPLRLGDGLVIGDGGAGAVKQRGALTCDAWIHVGYNALGTLIHEKGTIQANSTVCVGEFPGASGSYYHLSGTAALNVAYQEIIGYMGAGSFLQSGGTNTAGGLYLGYHDYYPGLSHGRYTLNGGTLTAGQIVVGGGDPVFPIGGGGTLTLNAGVATTAWTRVYEKGIIHYNGGKFTAGLLELTGGGDVILSPGASKTLKTTSVYIDTVNGSRLDLADNRMIVDYAGTSPIDSIRQLIQSGSAGAWSGAGLTSSSAAADSTKALGYGEAAVLGLTSFGGYSVDATSLLIKYTWRGDTNLDGQVDITDLGNLATHWQTPSMWTSGDFDYSGFIDITDLGMLATNWQAGVGSPLGQDFNEALASAGLAGDSVPEPAAAILLAVGLAVLCRRQGPSCS